MRGNDIIDLQAASRETNWRRKGFLEKICTPNELHYVFDADDPDRAVWKLWSIKESAYKVHVRSVKTRSFAPWQLSCTILDNTKSQVAIGGCYYTCSTLETTGYIYSTAVAAEETKAPVIDHCFLVRGENWLQQQEYIYQRIIDRYAGLAGCKKEALRICKDALNIPSLYDSEDHSRLPMSITHHGRYAAFTIN